MRSGSILGVVVTACVMAAAPVQAQAPTANRPTRIGVVDIQRVLLRSAAGVSAREGLERDKAAMQKEVEGKRVELQKLRDELEKTGSLLTPQSRQEKQDLFERTIRDANRLADDFQKELEGKERMLLQKVLVDISGIVERVGKEQGYALILERRRLLLFAEEVDLTEEIIRAYDREAGAKGKK